MRIRAPWIYVTAVLLAGLLCLDTALPLARAAGRRQQPAAPQQQQGARVERVDIEGNRRLRDEDVLYHIQTRAGDPFSPDQVQRDLITLLNLPFFDKTETRVSTETGPLGGVVVIFNVRELPIVRDVDFKGLKSVPESDVLKAFREQRVGVSKETSFDPVKVNNAKR